MKLPVKLFFIVFLASACQPQTKSKLPFYDSFDFTPHWFSYKEVPNDFHVIGSFEFQDQEGYKIDQTIFKDQITLVNFFFTSCPGICPTIMQNIKNVRDSLSSLKMQSLSFSVDSEYDQVERLNYYAHEQNIQYPEWKLLTGDKISIYTLARESFFADEDLGEPIDSNDFLHTENTYLIDQKGRIRGVYKGTFPLEMNHLIQDARLLMQEVGTQ